MMGGGEKGQENGRVSPFWQLRRPRILRSMLNMVKCYRSWTSSI